MKVDIVNQFTVTNDSGKSMTFQLYQWVDLSWDLGQEPDIGSERSPIIGFNEHGVTVLADGDYPREFLWEHISFISDASTLEGICLEE